MDVGLRPDFAVLPAGRSSLLLYCAFVGEYGCSLLGVEVCKRFCRFPQNVYVLVPQVIAIRCVLHCEMAVFAKSNRPFWNVKRPVWAIDVRRGGASSWVCKRLFRCGQCCTLGFWRCVLISYSSTHSVLGVHFSHGLWCLSSCFFVVAFIFIIPLNFAERQQKYITGSHRKPLDKKSKQLLRTQESRARLFACQLGSLEQRIAGL